MKHPLVLSLICFYSTFNLNAQEFEFRINAASSFTFLPDFTNEVLIANDGLIIPNLIDPSNSVTPLSNYSYKAEPSSGLGFSIELEFGVSFNERWRLTFLGGLNQMKYQYETIVDIEGSTSYNLNDMVSDYGTHKLLYANFKPVNVSATIISDKLSILFGPSFNFLVNSSYYNVVLIYGDETNREVDKAFFETLGELNNILYGANLRLDYNIIPLLSFYLSSQYYFNSIFDTKENTIQTGEECSPLLLQIGLGFKLSR